MGTFTVSNAQSLRFRIETGAGTIRAGETIPDNYLYTDFNTYHDSCAETGADYIYHDFAATDSINVQVQHAADLPENVPSIRIWNANTGTVIDWKTQSATSGNYWNFLIDWSDYGTGCYYVTVDTSEGDESSTATALNKFQDGGQGEHESGITGIVSGFDTNNNVVTQSAAQANRGSNSALITSPPSGVTSHNRLIYAGSTAINLTEGHIYKAVAYVYVPTASQFAPNGSVITLQVDNDGALGCGGAVCYRGWTDAEILSAISTESFTIGGGTLDAWQQLTVYFICRADTQGHLRIECDTNPNTSAVVYVDTVYLFDQTAVTEATSETVDVSTAAADYPLLQWSLDSNGMGMSYAGGLSSTINRARIKLSWFKFRMEDTDFLNQRSGGGASTVQKANPYKVHTVTFPALPPYKLEQMGLALAHDTFTINGNEFILENPGFEPQWGDDDTVSTAPVVVELRRKSYDYQNSNC